MAVPIIQSAVHESQQMKFPMFTTVTNSNPNILQRGAVYKELLHWLDDCGWETDLDAWMVGRGAGVGVRLLDEQDVYRFEHAMSGFADMMGIKPEACGPRRNS